MDILKEIKDGVLVIHFTGNLLGEHVNGPILDEVKHSIEDAVFFISDSEADALERLKLLK